MMRRRGDIIYLLLMLELSIETRFSQQLESNSRLKGSSSLSDLFMHNYKPVQQQQTRTQISMRNFQDLITRTTGNLNSLESSSPEQAAYKCAKYCSCSIVKISKDKLERGVNLTQAKCENPLFSDLLTIDRRTQIIHISLPSANNQNEDDNNNNNNNDDNESSNQQQKATSEQKFSTNKRPFRMPRLVQFNILREIVIKNLKFQVCDSEVFKRGQNLRRFKLNHNHLSRLSKACFKHLDKLIELNLDHNKLSELESALFNSLMNLKSLSIAYNQLSELAAHQFANLTNLVSLNLVGNSFKTINLHLFEPMQNSLNVLILAKNEIKAFLHAPINYNNNQAANSTTTTTQILKNSLFSGVIFKNLIKLNMDENKLERIKALQLHRFFNIKFLSVRQNNIATIRDKAFNGLKLIELNLAQNQLQTISKCAFCNATIKRLVLAQNNISIPIPSMFLDPLASPVARPLTSGNGNVNDSPPDPPQALISGMNEPSQVISASSSQNMLILSQSVFGPLFGQLEYLDISHNEFLADQLDLLLEPLLQLEYLNIAKVGFDRSLPTPSLFKNNRLLKYLNMSNNQLDLIVAETIEPLTSLQVLDLSYNKFSELDESFLVTMDELTSLKVVNFGWNPWFCSQCKVAPLYDWILRSSIYNSTCIAPSSGSNVQPAEEEPASNDDQLIQQAGGDLDARFTLVYKPRLISATHSADDYNLLLSNEEDKFDSSLLNFESTSKNDDEYLDSILSFNGRQPGIILTRTAEDDHSIMQTMEIISRLSTSSIQFNPNDYCMKCEFPGELRSYNIHELSSSDFKFCAGAAPRFAASEPKIGLTLAIVIIGALFCIIIVVIVMYRKKSNTYYTNEDTDHLEAGAGGKRPVFSVSSDAENPYGDGTDYSSPPMSQSFESYSGSQEGEEEEEEEDEEEEEEMVEEEEFEEEDDSNEDEATTGESFTQDSHSTNARRLAEAEKERRHQLDEYNKNELKIQSSQSIRELSSSGELTPAQTLRPTKREIAEKRQPSLVLVADSQRSPIEETKNEPAQLSISTSPEELVLSPANLEKTAPKVANSKLIQTPSVESQSIGRSLRTARRILSITNRSREDSLASSSTLPSKLADDDDKQSPEHNNQAKQHHHHLRQQSSLQSGGHSSSAGRRSVKSAQTIDSAPIVAQLATSSPRAQSSRAAQRPQTAHLNRQRLAFSKEHSQQNQRQAWQNLPAREPSSFKQTEPRVEMNSPTISDETMADSIALEALEYAVSDEVDEEPLGGALELNSASSGGELAEEDDNDYERRRKAPARGQLHFEQPRSGHSSHSALTQTGSQELAE